MNDRIRLSSLTLIAANLPPLVGVLFFDWSVSSVIILYWFENIVLGLINVARMIAMPAGEAGAAAHVGKLFIVPFFMFHYFFFCAGHGIFVFGLFPDENAYFPPLGGMSLIGVLGRAVEIFSTPLAFAALTLAASHTISFVVNYLAGGERASFDLQKLMMLPYNRIIVLHVTIILGGFVTLALGEPVGVLVILVLLKTGVDLTMHRKEHRESPAGADTNESRG